MKDYSFLIGATISFILGAFISRDNRLFIQICAIILAFAPIFIKELFESNHEGAKG